MKRFLLTLIGLGVLFIFWYLFVKPVEATQISYTVCHHTPGNNVTLTFNTIQAYLGHLGTPHSGQTYDTYTACPSPSPTPSATPSSTPSPTPEPSSTPEPSETPAPSEEPTPGGEANHAQLAPVDTAWHPEECIAIKHRPTITEVRRTSPISIYAKWTKVDDVVSRYFVEYGLASGLPLWHTIVEGNETDLGFLPVNHVLWLRVAGISPGGCLGGFSDWIDP